MSDKVSAAADAFRAARDAAKNGFRYKMQDFIREESREELARLSVELHAAYNAGMSKEQLRVESRFYSNPQFDEAWNAVPYAGRDVKPGRLGSYASPVKAASDTRYTLALVDNTDSQMGRGVLVTAFEGTALPTPLNLRLMRLDRDGVAEYTALDMPYTEEGESTAPGWWEEIVYASGEYVRFQKEVNEFVKKEIGE